MKLSIIIPCYNIENYISECLHSLLPYVNDDVEVIIIDDCSTDHTINRIRGAIMMYSMKNITLICNPVNKGVSASRNFGLQHACGSYVAFIDGDDFVTPKYVSSIMRFCSSGYDYAILSWKKFGGDNKEFYSKSLPNWNKSVWSRVFKKSIIKNLFDESMSWGEDAKFIDQNIVRGHKIAYIDECIYIYRWGRPDSITSNKVGR